MENYESPAASWGSVLATAAARLDFNVRATSPYTGCHISAHRTRSRTTPHHTTPHHTTPHHATPHHTTPHHTTPHHTTPHHTTPHYTTPHHTTPHSPPNITQQHPHNNILHLRNTKAEGKGTGLSFWPSTLVALAAYRCVSPEGGCCNWIGSTGSAVRLANEGGQRKILPLGHVVGITYGWEQPAELLFLRRVVKDSWYGAPCKHQIASCTHPKKRDRQRNCFSFVHVNHKTSET